MEWKRMEVLMLTTLLICGVVVTDGWAGYNPGTIYNYRSARPGPVAMGCPPPQVKPAPVYVPQRYVLPYWDNFCWPQLHVNFTVEPRWWFFLDVSGHVGVKGDVWPATLGFGPLSDDNGDFSGRVTAQMWGPDGPKLRVGTVGIKLDGRFVYDRLSPTLPDPGGTGTATGHRDLYRSGNVKLDMYEVAFEFFTYETPSGRHTFRPLLEIRPMRLKASMSQQNYNPATQVIETTYYSAKQWTALPLLGTTYKYYMFEGLNIKGELKGLYYFGSGHILDGELGVGILPFSWLELEGGYRIMTMRWEGIGDINLKTTVHGPYLGGTIRF